MTVRRSAMRLALAASIAGRGLRVRRECICSDRARWAPAGLTSRGRPSVPPVSTAVLFGVDPVTGARRVFSDFGGSSPNAVAVEAEGSVLVTNADAGTDPSGGTSEWGALHRLRRNPVTGELVRTILTDFGVGPSTGRDPCGRG